MLAAPAALGVFKYLGRLSFHYSNAGVRRTKIDTNCLCCHGSCLLLPNGLDATCALAPLSELPPIRFVHIYSKVLRCLFDVGKSEAAFLIGDAF